MQLRPPMADYVFGDPINADFYLPHLMQPIFEEFVYMKLSENHRQSGDKVYAELLERIRFGEHDENDLALLQSRVIQDLTKVPQDALMICGTNQAVENYNRQKLLEGGGDIFEVESKKVPPIGNKSYKFPQNKDGSLENTPFMDFLRLKIGSTVILTYNINVKDKLTNGQRGIVQKLLFDKKKSLECIIVKFNDPRR